MTVSDRTRRLRRVHHQTGDAYMQARIRFGKESPEAEAARTRYHDAFHVYQASLDADRAEDDRG